MSEDPHEEACEQMREAVDARDVAALDACYRTAHADPSLRSVCEMAMYDLVLARWVPGLEVAHRYCRELDIRNSGGLSLLTVAVQEADLATTRWLLEHGATASFSNSNGTTPLASATALRSISRETELHDLLLAHGASHDIHSTIEIGELEPVREFLEANPDSVRQHAGRDAFVSLAIGAFTNRIKSQQEHPFVHWQLDDQSLNELQELLTLLLRHGAEIDGRSMGETALHRACSSNSTDPRVVQLLLEKGADVNAQSAGEGATPMDNALMVKAPFVDLLRSHGGRATKPVVDIEQMMWGHIANLKERLEGDPDADSSD